MGEQTADNAFMILMLVIGIGLFAVTSIIHSSLLNTDCYTPAARNANVWITSLSVVLAVVSIAFFLCKNLCQCPGGDSSYMIYVTMMFGVSLISLIFSIKLSKQIGEKCDSATKWVYILIGVSSVSMAFCAGMVIYRIKKIENGKQTSTGSTSSGNNSSRYTRLENISAQKRKADAEYEQKQKELDSAESRSQQLGAHEQAEIERLLMEDELDQYDTKSSF